MDISNHEKEKEILRNGTDMCQSEKLIDLLGQKVLNPKHHKNLHALSILMPV